MPRQPRVEYEGAIYHIISRGNNRDQIFYSKTDIDLFYRVLEEAVTRFNLDLFAYCLMPNHYHLALRTPEGNLSKSMAWIQTTFTTRYKVKHKRIGHLFQGRYKAHLVESGDYLKTLIYYIHLNPVRSRKSGKLSYSGSYEDLKQFEASSHRFYEGRKKPDWLNLEPVKLWGKPDTEAAKEYRRTIKSLVADKPLDWKDHIQFGLCAGTDSFVELIKEKISEKSHLSENTGKLELNRLSLAERKLLLESHLKSQNDPRIVIWARVKLLGERSVDIAREKGYRDGSSILHIVKRVDIRSRKDLITKHALMKLRKIASSV